MEKLKILLRHYGNTEKGASTLTTLLGLLKFNWSIVQPMKPAAPIKGTEKNIFQLLVSDKPTPSMTESRPFQELQW